MKQQNRGGQYSIVYSNLKKIHVIPKWKQIFKQSSDNYYYYYYYYYYHYYS